MPIRHDSVVDDLMRTQPATIRTFLDFRMGCCGCPIATFHTVDDACREHDVDRDVFLVALRDAMADQDSPGASESHEPASASATNA
uniref:DUF1858 domain-containing protein n=1 Tax=Rhodopseudomonas palustris (strain BisA53) TaxID=316055 RepID=Q07J88_RHOP5